MHVSVANVAFTSGKDFQQFPLSFPTFEAVDAKQNGSGPASLGDYDWLVRFANTLQHRGRVLPKVGYGYDFW